MKKKILLQILRGCISGLMIHTNSYILTGIPLCARLWEGFELKLMLSFKWERRFENL